MSFTGVLGSSSSQLANIQLGLGAAQFEDVSASNSYNVSHSVSVVVVRSLSVSNTLTLTNAAVKVLIHPATNTCSFGQTISIQLSKPIANSLVLSQAVGLSRISQKLTVQGLTTTHSLARNIVSGKAVTSSLSLTQSVSVLLAKNAQNTLTLAHDVDHELGKYFVHSVDLGFAMSYTGTYNKQALSYFQYGQSLTTTKILNLSVSNTLTYNQTAVAPSVRSGTNILVFYQNVSVTRSKPANNTLSLISTVRIQLTKNVSITSRLRLRQTDHRHGLSKSYAVGNAIGFNGFVKKWKQFDVAVSNTITFTQEQVRQRFIESVTSTLNFNQLAVSQKVITVSVAHTLTLAATVARQLTLSRSIQHTLVYSNFRTIYVPLANIGDIQIPNLIEVRIPGVSATGRRIYPHCVLQVPERAITLPAPEFNDGDGYGGMFTIRRSMNGGTVTYVHRLDTNTLKYDFVFGERKYLELEDYLLNFNSRIHTLTNWKGERWYVFITNNPMELIARSRYTNSLNNSFDDREKYTVTLEFEGTRIN